MFTVTVTEKDGPSETHTFDKTEVGIGRVKGNDIVLPKGNVSKRHSRIVVKDGKFIVVDLKSTNGTYVNGRKITSPQVIKTVDKVYIGDFIIAVAESAAPAPAKAKEEVAATSDIQSMSPSGMSAKTPSSKPQPSTPKKAAKRPSAQKESPAAEPKAKLETVRRTPTMAAPNLGPSQQRPSSTTPAKVMRGAATNTASASSSSVKAPAVQAVSAPSAPALELHTPGAGGVPPKPQFKSEFDEAFAKNQRTAAEAFFQSIDPSTLTLHYPPSPEDRTAIEGSVKEIAKAAGGGDDLFEHLTHLEIVRVPLVIVDVTTGQRGLIQVPDQRLLSYGQRLEAVGIQLYDGGVLDALQQVGPLSQLLRHQHASAHA